MPNTSDAPTSTAAVCSWFAPKSASGTAAICQKRPVFLPQSASASGISAPAVQASGQ